MDVRCEKCLTEYDFDDAQVPEAGVTVKCTTCGFVFKVKKRVAAAPPPGRTDEFAPDAAQIDKAREWKIRQPSGNVFTCRELTTLQKWIVERKVAREDEISLSGDQWKRLGDIPELAGFFLVVDQALRGQALEQQLGTDATLHRAATRIRPPAAAGPTQLGTRARPPPEPTFADVGEDEDEDLRAIKRRGPGVWLGALLLLGAAGAGAWAYVHSQRPAPVPVEAASSSGSSSSGSGSGSTTGAILAAGGSTGSGSSASSTGSSASSSSSSSSASSSGSSGSGSSSGSTGSSGSSGASSPGGGTPTPARPAQSPVLAQPATKRHGGGGGGAPSGVEGLSARGLKLIDKERYDEAEEMFRKALAISPGYADAQYGLAEALKYSGKKAEAIKMYKQFLEDHPSSDDAPAARRALQTISE